MFNKNEFINDENDKIKSNYYKINNFMDKFNNKIYNIALLIKLILISLFIIIYILIKQKQNLINIININTNNLQYRIKLLEQNQQLLIKLNKYNYLSKNNKNQNFDIINVFCPMEVKGKKKIRIGKNGDGGYIILDDFENVKIAYSFGISNEVSFDQALADKNIDIFMYDHTISNLPYENPKFHWKKIGLSSKNNSEQNLKMLNELIIENGHTKEKNMILKLDIESSEWEVFKDISSDILKQFKFIVAEFHFNKENKLIQLEILKKIKITHQIFHLHCNNCSNEIIYFEGYYICPLLEISFIQKEGYIFSKFNSSFPIDGLDYKNCANNEQLDELLNIFI